MLFPKDRMNVHKNARLTPRGRERIVRQIKSPQPPQAVGLAAGVVDVHAEVKFQLR
jgi:hypothetical protein